jgi:predicted nucleotidyltransferase
MPILKKSDIEKIKENILATHNLWALLLGGSYAEGRQRPSSDIDLVGILPETAESDFFAESFFYNEVFVDVKFYKESDYFKKLSPASSFTPQIVLFELEKHGYEFKLKIQNLIENGFVSDPAIVEFKKHQYLRTLEKSYPLDKLSTLLRHQEFLSLSKSNYLYFREKYDMSPSAFESYLLTYDPRMLDLFEQAFRHPDNFNLSLALYQYVIREHETL